MRNEDFFRMLSSIDEKYIVNTGKKLENYRKKQSYNEKNNQKRFWKNTIATVACTVGAFLGVFVVLLKIGEIKSDSDRTGISITLDSSGLSSPTSLITSAAQNELEEIPTTTGMLPIPEKTVYQFNGFSAELKGYQYDGMTLYLSYDITYENGVSDDYQNDITLRPYGGNVKIKPPATTQLLYRNDNTVGLMWQYTNCEVVEALDILIMTTNQNATPEDVTEAYKYTISIPEGVGHYSVDTDYKISQPNGDIITLNHLNICRDTVGFVFDGEWKDDYKFETTIVTDGMLLTLNESTQIFSEGDESGYYILYRVNTSAVDAIKSMIINDKEISFNDWLSYSDNRTG